MDLPVISEIDNYGEVLIYQQMWYRKKKHDDCPVCGGEEEVILDFNGLNSKCKVCGQAMNFGMMKE